MHIPSLDEMDAKHAKRYFFQAKVQGVASLKMKDMSEDNTVYRITELGHLRPEQL